MIMVKITGKLCKKMIHSGMPYWMIVKIIHETQPLDNKFIETLTDKIANVNEAHKKLTCYSLSDKIKDMFEIKLR